MLESEVNIRLLMMFDQVYRTRSMSKAAGHLGLSQPSVSIGIGKLRAHFGDALFVRTGTGMEPTPHAQQLAGGVRKALDMLNQSMSYKSTFEPLSSRRHFHICMTDITQMDILPQLLAQLRSQAPGVTLKVSRVKPETARALEAGEADVAVGFLPDAGNGFYEQVILLRDFVCLVSVDHPRIRLSMTLAQFNAEPHVVVVAPGSGLRRAEEVMLARKVQRRIMVEVPDLVGLDSVVSGSELIATVPRPVGALLASRGAVRVVEHPIRLPEYAVTQLWHERFHRDPGNQWIRKLISELFTARAFRPPR